MKTDKLYVVSLKHYGDDDCCGCQFQALKAFTSLEDAKEFIKIDDEYDYDVVSLVDKKGDN